MYVDRLKRCNLCLIPLLLIFISTFNVGAVSISKNFVYLSKGKKMLLKASDSGNIDWSSNNSSIASIDSKGFVKAENVGSTTVIAKDKISGGCSCCTVNVTKEEPIRFTYCAQNDFKVGENVDIYAITSKNTKSVKFDIYNNGKKTELNGLVNFEEGNTLVWRGKLNIKNQNQYKLVAYGLSDGVWSKNNSANIVIYANNNQELKEKVASDRCIEFISSCEGFAREIYCDRLVANVFTIGYGHVVKPYESFFDSISSREAKALLKADVNSGAYTKDLNNFMIKNKIICNQNQFDALVSFSYNVGTSWMNNSNLRNIIIDSGNNREKHLIGTIRSDNGLNVRSMPNSASKRMCALKNGTKVHIIDKNKIDGYWYKVRLEDGTVGYCYGDYMEVVEEDTGCKNLSDIDIDRFIRQFSEYHHASGKCYWGLLTRRFYELDMFLYGKYGINGRYSSKYSNLHNYPIPECIKGK